MPGATYHPFSAWDDFYVGFDQSQPLSSARCRLSAGYDNDTRPNDTNNGIMCLWIDGSERQAARHLVEAGYFLKGR